MRTILGLYLVIHVSIAAGCSGADDDSPGADGGGPGDGDGGPGGGGDGDAAVSLTVECSAVRTLDRYPWGITAGTYLGDYDLVLGIMADDVQSPLSQLTLEVWPGPGGGPAPSLPADRTFTTASRYNECDVCMLMSEGCVGSECRTFFFPQGGQVHVSTADRNAEVGAMTATGSNLVFVEWSLETDAPVPGGRCVELSTFALAAEWGGTGGSCSGDECGPDGACCADSPYCSLGDNNIGRFCSDYCGGSGDGCAGPDDCCDGFTCFLGTCILDGCAGDPCTGGLDGGGGCCGEAPYCTGDGSCAVQCGAGGDGCAGDLDCCTGLTCSGGTCG